MNQKEIVARILELKKQQSDIFKKKKIERDLEQLKQIREEWNDLKKKAQAMLRPHKKYTKPTNS